MDTPNRELQTGTAGAGLGLALHLASFATARHNDSLKLSLQSPSLLIIKDRSGTFKCPQCAQLLGASVLGDGFGALRHGVFG